MKVWSTESHNTSEACSIYIRIIDGINGLHYCWYLHIQVLRYLRILSLHSHNITQLTQWRICNTLFKYNIIHSYYKALTTYSFYMYFYLQCLTGLKFGIIHLRLGHIGFSDVTHFLPYTFWQRRNKPCLPIGFQK